jgi:hypothetical protein
LDAGDLERRRVARDLHDGAQQKFVNAVINLQLAKAKLGSDPSRAERYLEAALRQSESGLAELRAFAAGVHPPILTHLGLGAAVASLADEFPIPLEINVVPDRLPRFLEAGLYFFIAEALTNVVKHARATGASVQVTTTATRLTTEVQDDGIGGARLSDGGSGPIGSRPSAVTSRSPAPRTKARSSVRRFPCPATSILNLALISPVGERRELTISATRHAGACANSARSSSALDSRQRTTSTSSSASITICAPS